MAIEMYDAAKKVRKDDTTYFLVKYGSKNCFTYPGSSLLDNDLRPRWTTRETRESDWHVVAKTKRNIKMAVTRWNCPTSYVYGRIQFGNGKNIALYLDRQSPTEYRHMDEVQQSNFDHLVGIAENVDQKYSNSLVDLDKYPDIPQEKLYQPVHEYCGEEYRIGDRGNGKQYASGLYWNLDNL